MTNTNTPVDIRKLAEHYVSELEGIPLMNDEDNVLAMAKWIVSQPILSPATPSEAVEVEERLQSAALAVRTAGNCGLNLEGETVFCDDMRLEGMKDDYGSNIRFKECECKEAAKAVLQADDQFRASRAMDSIPSHGTGDTDR